MYRLNIIKDTPKITKKKLFKFFKKFRKELPGGPVVKTPCLQYWGPRFNIPGQGTKILHAVQSSQNTTAAKKDTPIIQEIPRGLGALPEGPGSETSIRTDSVPSARQVKSTWFHRSENGARPVASKKAHDHLAGRTGLQT